MRNERYRKNAISVRERHNERKNEVYSNPDVLLEYSHNNVTFKACEAATYAQQFDRMVEEGVVSTRGLKPDAYVFDELVFDVNTDYFETHGGYEYAKQFYAEVYELAKEIAGGEQYIISAIMHADERNREASDRLGRNVFHYHLHVVYLPVVEKQIRWSKRCKDPALRGTVRETIMQVSHSKKWPMVPMTDEQGQPVLKKNGKPRLVSSYSLLQTQFFEHMRQAGFTDFERGIEGSDAEHLNVLEYKVQKERQTVAELSDQTKQLQGQRKELIFQVKNISRSIRDVADIEQRAKTKGVLEKRVELPVQDFQTLCEMAKASGKLQAENRSMQMQLQQSTGATPAPQPLRGTAGCGAQRDTALPGSHAGGTGAGAGVCVGHLPPPTGGKAAEPSAAPPAGQGTRSMTKHTIRQQGAALQKGAATEDRQENTTSQAAASAKNREDGVPQQELERFARFLLPKIQAFYQSEEGQRLFEEWKEKRR